MNKQISCRKILQCTVEVGPKRSDFHHLFADQRAEGERAAANDDAFIPTGARLSSVIASIVFSQQRDQKCQTADHAQSSLQLEAAARRRRVAAAGGARYSFSSECMPERMRADIQGNCDRKE
jgi:hypothetical protein